MAPQQPAEGATTAWTPLPCPPRWARTSQRLMRDAGVDATLQLYEGEGHAFYARWQDSMDRSIRFIRRAFRSA